jgi:hypothetical protein
LLDNRSAGFNSTIPFRATALDLGVSGETSMPLSVTGGANGVINGNPSSHTSATVLAGKRAYKSAREAMGMGQATVGKKGTTTRNDAGVSGATEEDTRASGSTNQYVEAMGADEDAGTMRADQDSEVMVADQDGTEDKGAIMEAGVIGNDEDAEAMGAVEEVGAVGNDQDSEESKDQNTAAAATDSISSNNRKLINYVKTGDAMVQAAVMDMRGGHGHASVFAEQSVSQAFEIRKPRVAAGRMIGGSLRYSPVEALREADCWMEPVVYFSLPLYRVMLQPVPFNYSSGIKGTPGYGFRALKPGRGTDQRSKERRERSLGNIVRNQTGLQG